MSENVLHAILRESKGKNEMRRLREEGMIPAIFYGARYETKSIAVKTKDLEQAVTHRKGLVNLNIEGAGEFEVIFREIQRDPVSDKIQHVDFLGITRGQKMTSTISVVLVGEPVGVKTGGGVLEFVRRQLEIECLPKDLPEKIVVNVAELDIGESIHVEDLEIENVVFLHSPKTTIAAVAAPTISKALAEEIEAEEEAGEGEEGEGEEKKE